MSHLSSGFNMYMSTVNMAELELLSHAEIKPRLEQIFVERYGSSNKKIISVAAPARVNIIGEHIDYNGGVVLPAAINRYLYVLVRKRFDTKIQYTALQFLETFNFDISDHFVYEEKNSYANYLNGMLSILQNRGCVLASGFEVLIFSNIPVGSGLSSSAALEIGFGFSVAKLFNFTVDGIELAKMGQEAEHHFMNVKCGIMDQFIIAMGEKNCVLLLNTETLAYEVIPTSLEKYIVVILNSKKSRILADSKYNERRTECETALEMLRTEKPELSHLCALSNADFETVKNIISDTTIFKRVHHCVSENERVHKAVEALKNGNEVELGHILLESHSSLRADYEVTGFELDSLVAAAFASPYCCGARMTGAGFGGCAVALVDKEHIAEFIKTTQEQYQRETTLLADIFPCELSKGVSLF